MTSRSTPLRYLALGDSYTIGESVPTAACWPMQLVELLRQEGVVIEDPRIVAVTGWTTDELSLGMDQASLVPAYDLASLLIGVNNQYRGRSSAEYRHEFRQLLRRAVALTGNRPDRTLVISIPDWGTTPFARQHGHDLPRIADALDAFNDVAREETHQIGARWMDITTISRQHPQMIADDGLHPSSAQYTLWSQAILPVARNALSA